MSCLHYFKEWEEKASKLKEEYVEAMKEYKASGGGLDTSSVPSKSKSKSSQKSSLSTSKVGSGSTFISKEFIEDDSSSDDDNKKPTVSIFWYIWDSLTILNSM